jgi:hypothetical protein
MFVRGALTVFFCAEHHTVSFCFKNYFCYLFCCCFSQLLFSRLKSAPTCGSTQAIRRDVAATARPVPTAAATLPLADEEADEDASGVAAPSVSGPMQATRSYTVRCSFCQIYQENVYDLLAKHDAANASGLRIRWDPMRDFYVENLYAFECKSANESIRLFRQGIARRVVAGHKMNAASSRSHCLFTIQVCARVCVCVCVCVC